MPAPLIPIPSPFPNIEIPEPYWLNKLEDFLYIQCADPALLFVEVALVAALRAWWTIETPSTKQILKNRSGLSWIQSLREAHNMERDWRGGIRSEPTRRQKVSSWKNRHSPYTSFYQGQAGALEAESNGTRFIWSMWRGLDEFVFWQFIGDIIGQGLIEWSTVVNKVSQKCKGDESNGRGFVMVGGWPYVKDYWMTGPSYLSRKGNLIGPIIPINKNSGAVDVWWGDYRGLYGSPVTYSCRTIIRGTDIVVAQDSVDGFDKPHHKAIIALDNSKLYPYAGEQLWNQVKFSNCIDGRIVGGSGGCYISSKGF
jgi:hypothetical protein